MVDKVGDLPQVGGDQVRGEQGEHLLLWASVEIFQDGQVWAGGNQQLEIGEAVHLGMINFLDLDMVKEKDKGKGESEWPSIHVGHFVGIHCDALVSWIV